MADNQHRDASVSVSPHVVGHAQVSTIMRDVLLALLPGTILSCIFFSWGTLLNICIAIVFAIGAEALILKARQRPILPALSDYSAIVTAWLFALCLPPLLPWWIVALGIVFAIVVAKHLYGGLGFNPFNPAMVGYAFLLISFPRELTAWLPPVSIAETLPAMKDIVASSFQGAPIDSFTMATPLDSMKSELSRTGELPVLSESALSGWVAGAGWEWLGLCWLLGGLWLIYRKIINWVVPGALLGTLFLMASLFYLYDASVYASPIFHLFSGAAIIGAFFIATDPVTAPSSTGGKVMFACGIGVLIYVIRTWGGYPDAVAFAVLLMNMAVPTIDYFYQPRVYGQ